MNEAFLIGPYEAREFFARAPHGSVCRVDDPTDGETLLARLYAPTGNPDPVQLSGWHEEFAAGIARWQAHGRNIVGIRDLGRAGDLAWIVRDEVEGSFLEDALDGEAMSPGEALDMLGRLAEALDDIHEAGLVHRSLKPSNVVLAADGEILFVDTVVLGRVSEAVLAGNLPLDRIAYVAPETVLGYRQRAAANRYTLAAIAYRMLTGCLPHAETSPVDYAYACVYTAHVAPSTHDTALDAIDGVMARALDKEPDDRYPTAAEFVAELRAALPAAEPAPSQDAEEQEPEHLAEAALATLPLAPEPMDAAATAPFPFIVPEPPPDEAETLTPAPRRAGAQALDEVEIEWFEDDAPVFELVAEPVPAEPEPLREVPDFEAEDDAAEGFRGGDTEPREAVATERDAPLEATEPGAALEPAKPDVALDAAEPRTRPEPTPAPNPVVESPEIADLPPGLRGGRRGGLWSNLRRSLSRWGGTVSNRVGTGLGRAPDHMMREAYLADWRARTPVGQAVAAEADDPVAPEWSLRVETDEPAWLRVEGRYAGPAPADITIQGRAGQEVRVEVMRDGACVAEQEVKLHPLMPKVWAPETEV